MRQLLSKPCESCGEIMTQRRNHSAAYWATRRFCSKSCAITGENNPWWKGGRYMHSGGYVYVKAHGHPMADDRGYVLEHRLVMSEAIGRPLTDEEQVHHINEIKTDNRLVNLMLFANAAEHAAYHRELERIAL